MVKQFLKITVLIIAALFCAICVTASAKSGTFPSAASVVGEWLEIKRELSHFQNSVSFGNGSGKTGLTTGFSTKSKGAFPKTEVLEKPQLNTDDTASLAVRIESFRQTVESFLVSPVGSLYKVQRQDEMRTFETIIPSVEQLKTAVLYEDGNQSVFPLVLEIDTYIDLLRNIDESLSDASLLRYFQLFFFFSILIIIIILALRMLHSRVDMAEKRERQSLSFSRETMIAQEQERGRIARELHDTVAQDLWRLSFQTDSIGKTADAAERSRLCAEVVSEQKELMRRIRAICDHLIPPDFQRRGLADTLGSLCSNFQQRTGIECQLTIQKNLNLDSLDNDTQLQCFRIVQECFANIEKHAQAKEASVLVRSEGDKTLFICVSDNGRGFSPPDRDESRRLLAEGHFGLWSMYERAASLSGTLIVDSSEGEGAIITLQIPLISWGGGGR
jgi:signal transduction histidine kinase